MSSAFRYLARELAKSYAMIGIALLVLFDLLAFLRESQDIGDAHYTVLDALLVVAYGTPALLVDLAPFVALLATLNAYDRLNASSELIALRAAGVSGMRLGWIAVMVAAAWVVTIAGVEAVARPLHLEASLLRMHETAPTGNVLRGGGFWIRSGNTFVNVASLEGARSAGDVRVVHFTPDGRLESYLRAGSANIVDATHWELEDVWLKSFRADGSPAVAESLVALNWQPPWDRSVALYDLPITTFTIPELRHRIGHAANEPVGAQVARTEFWRRATLPVAILAYALLAVPFALLRYARGGRSGRLAIGAALAFVVYIAQQVITNAGILAGLSTAVTAVVPPLIVFFCALLAMRRTY